MGGFVPTEAEVHPVMSDKITIRRPDVTMNDEERPGAHRQVKETA
jgi:hypothetical protein